MKKKLVEDMDQTYDEQSQKLPSLIDVPIFNELQVLKYINRSLM